MPGLNLHLYPCGFEHDHRVFRETETLARSGIVQGIHLLGIETLPLPEHEQLDETRSIWRVPRRVAGRLRLPTGRSTSGQVEWSLRLLHRYRRQRVSIIHCHSLDALPASVLLKWSHPGARLLYDPQELETETDWLRGARQKVARMQEASLIRQADEVTVVNESIAGWYKARYPGLGEVSIIRNSPIRSTEVPGRSDLLRRRLGIPQGEMLFIFQGALTEPRGVDFLLHAFTRLRTRKHIVFLGFGPREQMVREHAARHSNIHFHPAVPFERLLEHTASADVGIHLLENWSLNAYYCLPNKVFEYLLAGLPIVVRDYPELARLVDELGCGWKLSGGVEDVVGFLDALTSPAVQAKAVHVSSVRARLGWEHDERVLLGIYRRLLGKPAEE